MYVWQSLNKNQKHIVKFLAQNALKNIGLEDSENSHLTFSELLDICIEEVLPPPRRSSSPPTTSSARTCWSCSTTR